MDAEILDKINGKSDGSTADYYTLPEGATQLQDLISYRDMNAQVGEIFRACFRYGLASHSDMLRDAKKMKFYAEAEIARLERRRKPRLSEHEEELEATTQALVQDVARIQAEESKKAAELTKACTPTHTERIKFHAEEQEILLALLDLVPHTGIKVIELGRAMAAKGYWLPDLDYYLGKLVKGNAVYFSTLSSTWCRVA